MSHDVGSPFEGAAIDGGSKGVVYDKWHAMLMGDAGKFLNIEHIDAGVRDGFTEHTAGIGLESLVDFFFGRIGIDEGTFDTQFL